MSGIKIRKRLAVLTLALLIITGCFRSRPPHEGRVADAEAGSGLSDAIVCVIPTLKCPRIGLVEGKPDIRKRPLHEVLTNPNGDFNFSGETIKTPLGCRVLNDTICFKPGYFPWFQRGIPSRIRLRPMRHYLDYLPFRHPREYYPGVSHAHDPRLYLRESRRLIPQRFSGLTRRFRNESRLLTDQLKKLNAWRFMPQDAPGVFLNAPGHQFNRLAASSLGKNLLAQCAHENRWYRIHSTRSLSPIPGTGKETLFLTRLPPNLNDPFPIARNREIHFTRGLRESKSPSKALRNDSVQTTGGAIQAMAWGSGSVMTIEGDGRFLCHYGTAGAAVNFYGQSDASFHATRPGLLKKFVLSDFLVSNEAGHFAFVLSDPHGNFIVLIRGESVWRIYRLAAFSSEKGQPQPLASLPKDPEITAAAVHARLYLGFRDKTLRSFSLPMGRRSNFTEDRTFFQNSRSVLAAPPTDMVLAGHLVVACGTECLYRFGPLGIPDRLVAVDRGPPSSPPPIWSHHENISRSPVRSVEKSDSKFFPGIRALHPAGKSRATRIHKKPSSSR